MISWLVVTGIKRIANSYTIWSSRLPVISIVMHALSQH